MSEIKKWTTYVSWHMPNVQKQDVFADTEENAVSIAQCLAFEKMKPGCVITGIEVSSYTSIDSDKKLCLVKS